MEIEWAAVCRSIVQRVDDGLNLYGACIDTSYVESLGEEIDLELVVVLRDSYENIENLTPHEMTTRVTAPDSVTVVLDATLPVKLGMAPGQEHPEGLAADYPVKLNLSFRGDLFGTYTIVLILDGQSTWALAHVLRLDDVS